MTLLNRFVWIFNAFLTRKACLVHVRRYVDAETQTRVYVEQIKYLSQHEITTVYVDFGHLAAFNEILAQTIAEQYYR
jgi:hypothetical protein